MSSGIYDRTSATILFVDDDTDTLIAYECLASEEGFTVLTAHDGYQAIALVETVIPDVVVLDIWLPGIDGFDVVRRLRGNARTRDVPILILSGDDSHEVHVAGKTCGCQAHLVKPVSGDELLHAVNVILTDKRAKWANGQRASSP